ncbi:MAG: DNA repair protein RadC [Acidobacteriota bacterium]
MSRETKIRRALSALQLTSQPDSASSEPASDSRSSTEDASTICQSLGQTPSEQRPRERLLRDGGGSLTDAELVAVLLRTGRPGQSAVEMAREILEEHGGLSGLLFSNRRRIQRHGLRAAKAATVLAALELARRLTREDIGAANPMDRPGAVASYLRVRYGRIDQEVMGALFLDVQNCLLSESEVFRGTLTGASVEPRAILREALLCGASGIVIFHTHPSGDPAPSLEDLEFTKRMARAGEIMGVRLIDHLIVGGFGRWVSLRQRLDW